MRAFIFSSLAALALAAVLGGCATTGSSDNSDTEGSASISESNIPAPQQLSKPDGYVKEIPVPTGYKTVDSDTFLFETRNGMKIATRVYKGDIALESVSRIYLREMPRYGWLAEYNSISGDRASQVYSRPGAVAQISIKGSPFGSEIRIHYTNYRGREGASNQEGDQSRPVYIDDTSS